MKIKLLTITKHISYPKARFNSPNNSLHYQYFVPIDTNVIYKNDNSLKKFVNLNFLNPKS